MVAVVWDDIPSLTIMKSWSKVFHSSLLSESEVETSGDSAGSSESTEKFIHALHFFNSWIAILQMNGYQWTERVLVIRSAAMKIYQGSYPKFY